MSKREPLEEQVITSFSPEANYYRNRKRKDVDKLFTLRDRTKDRRKKKQFDYLARQKWRSIVKTANEL